MLAPPPLGLAPNPVGNAGSAVEGSKQGFGLRSLVRLIQVSILLENIAIFMELFD